MNDGTANELRKDDLRQRIGPAVKELREREGWSLRDLGAKCGVSSAYLSRIERGSSVPSFSILASIASAFDVPPDYFIEFERSARELESALATVLEELEIPRSTWHEFADLSMEAQGALVGAVNRLTTPVVESDVHHQAAETAIVTEGVEQALDRILEIAETSGLSPIDFARHRTQIEEVKNERFAMLDRLCTLSAPWLFDQPDVFQGTFGVNPENPLLLKWWVRAQRSAMLKTLDGSTSRSIYPRESISSYIRTGHWGERVRFNPEQVRQHVEETIKLLRNCPTYHVGLLERPLPLRMIGKCGTGVLVMTHDDGVDRPQGERGMAMRFSSEIAVTRFQEYFDEIWDSIPEENRDREKVADWMEAELAQGMKQEPSPA